MNTNEYFETNFTLKFNIILNFNQIIDNLYNKNNNHW